MKHLSRVLTATCTLTLTAGADAAGLGNTLNNVGQFALGLNYEGIYEQGLELDKGHFSRTLLGSTGSGSFPELDDQILDAKMDSSRVFLEGTIGLHPRVDAFLKLGVAGTDAEYRVLEPGISDDSYKFDGDSNFAWGLGLRAKLYENGQNLRLMGRVEYMRSDTDTDPRVNGQSLAQNYADKLIAEGATDVSARSAGNIELQEFRAALVLGKSFGNFTPYGGVEYRYTDLILDMIVAGTESGAIPFGSSVNQEYEAKDSFGLLFGVDADFSRNFAFNAELGLI